MRGNELRRCAWARGELMERYHDEEWGVQVFDDQKLYEMLLLEAFQAGLSWYVILRKRENFRRAFDRFDAHKIAAYGEDKITALLDDAGIVRCRRKIEGAIVNARCFLEIQREFGSFADYLYSFTGGGPVINLTDEPRHYGAERPYGARYEEAGYEIHGLRYVVQLPSGRRRCKRS